MKTSLDEGEPAGDAFNAAELRFRARHDPRLREGFREGRASRLMLVILLLAGMVFVASVAVYFVNSRALTYEPDEASPPSRTQLPVDYAEYTKPEQTPNSAGSDSGTLYKCKGPGGTTSYTNEPCAATQETVWARSVQPDRRIMPAPSTSRAESAGEQPQVVYSLPESPSRREVQRTQCANAKQYEADVRRRRGLKITFAELRQLSDMVYEACKGL